MMGALTTCKIRPTNLGEAVTQVMNWLDLYATDRALVILALICLVLLAFLSRDDRRRLFWPLVIGAALIVNPILYFYVYSHTIYWRLFWLLPDAVLIALASVRILERIPLRLVRIPVFLILCALIMFVGRFTYGDSSFRRNGNPEGVSEATRAVADYLLSQEESPLCLVENSLYMDIRQYDGNIRLVYGRNAVGYITGAGKRVRRIARAMNEKETSYRQVLRLAISRKAGYIVVDKTDPIPKNLRDKYKYEKVRTIYDYIIYHRDFEE